MKIEITNAGDNGYQIYREGSIYPLLNNRVRFLQFYFSDDDIINLIGENKYNKAFINEGKYIFNVTISLLQFVSGERSAQTRNELLMYND